MLPPPEKPRIRAQERSPAKCTINTEDKGHALAAKSPHSACRRAPPLKHDSRSFLNFAGLHHRLCDSGPPLSIPNSSLTFFSSPLAPPALAPRARLLPATVIRPSTSASRLPPQPLPRSWRVAGHNDNLVLAAGVRNADTPALPLHRAARRTARCMAAGGSRS